MPFLSFLLCLRASVAKRAANKSLCLIAIANIALCFSVSAQSSPDIFIRTFATSDSVMLRWVPANVETWKAGIRYGYTIERYTTDQYFDLEGQDPQGKGTVINSAPILPLEKQDSAWNKLIRDDKLNAFVFQSLYEENNSSTNDPKKKGEEQIKFGFVLKACDLSVQTAKAHGLYFTDKTSVAGQVYIYRIRLAQIPAGKKHNPGIATADEKLSLINAPDKIQGDFRNRKAAITFSVLNTRESCAGYIIERSEDSIHYERINSTLLTFARSQYEQNKTDVVYQDSLPQNQKVYWYRVRGYSYFGFAGPPSVSVKGKGREEWISYPEADTLFSPDNKRVEIKWHLPAETNQANLAGFLILRAPSAGGPYSALTKTILTKTVFQFSDTDPLASNYYEIAAISTNGDTALSFPYFFGLTDNEPPPVPQNITGTIDTNGIVHLAWNKVTAADLKGYRVFRCNTLKEEFIEISDSILAENFFTDTIVIKTLTRNVYYSIRSSDMRYNSSAASTPLLLKRPDKIPPVAPVVISIYQTDSTIFFSWINSSSDDIMCLELTYKTQSDNLIQLGNWNGKDTVHSYTAINLIAGNEYSYSLTVTDSSGNKTTTVFPSIRFQPRIYPALKNVSAVPDFEKRTITLCWEKPAQEVDRYIIYKAKKGESFRAWKTINGKTTFIIDKELYPGNTYSYKIKAIMKSGAETKLESVEVVY
ncbi:MAG: fibronectin type III domain-containing protein [Bacteroidota bacterium]|nr:fibronectin type III domain-containing protein [Bacteroidota bacterium]